MQNDFLSGYLKSGGWRFGGKPTDGNYKYEDVDNGLLGRVGNPGVVDAALNKTPVTQVATTGLLSDGGSKGGDRDRTSGTAGNGTNYTDSEWATIKKNRDDIGWDNPFDMAGLDAVKRMFTNPFGLIADAVGGKVPQNDELRNIQARQMAYTQEGQNQRAAEARAMAEQQAAASAGLRSAPAGLSPDQMSEMQRAAMIADMTRAERGGGGSDSRGGGFGTGSERTGGDGFGGYSR